MRFLKSLVILFILVGSGNSIGNQASFDLFNLEFKNCADKNQKQLENLQVNTCKSVHIEDCLKGSIMLKRLDDGYVGVHYTDEKCQVLGNRLFFQCNGENGEKLENSFFHVTCGRSKLILTDENIDGHHKNHTSKVHSTTTSTTGISHTNSTDHHGGGNGHHGKRKHRNGKGKGKKNGHHGNSGTTKNENKITKFNIVQEEYDNLNLKQEKPVRKYKNINNNNNNEIIENNEINEIQNNNYQENNYENNDGFYENQVNTKPPKYNSNKVNSSITQQQQHVQQQQDDLVDLPNQYGSQGFAFGSASYSLEDIVDDSSELRQELNDTINLITDTPQLTPTELPTTQIPTTQIPVTQTPTEQVPVTEEPALGSAKTFKEFNILLPFCSDFGFVVANATCINIISELGCNPSSFKIEHLSDNQYTGIQYTDNDCMDIKLDKQYEFVCTDNERDIFTNDFFQVACSNKLLIEKEIIPEMEIILGQIGIENREQVSQIIEDNTKIQLPDRIFTRPNNLDEFQNHEQEKDIQSKLHSTTDEISPNLIEMENEIISTLNKTEHDKLNSNTTTNFSQNNNNVTNLNNNNENNNNCSKIQTNFNISSLIILISLILLFLI